MNASPTEDRKIVVVNQAANYLTVGIVNAFRKRFEDVSLITGHVHEQGEAIDPDVRITYINKYDERSTKRKIFSWIVAFVRIVYLLLTKYRKHEIFFISVPPFSYLAALFLPNRCSVLIWDVYPDLLKIYGISERHLVFRIWKKANAIALKKAFKVYTIGEKTADLLKKYLPRNKILITPLWTVFDNFATIPKRENFFAKTYNLQEKFVVQYSGNIGLTHNVEHLIVAANTLRSESDISFVIIGKGERVNKIKQMIRDYDLDNCTVLPFQSDDVFPYSLAAADLGVVILDDRTSKGSVPSKTYNLMAAGKPILYIASKDSELNTYSLKFRNGECFPAHDVAGISNFIKSLSRNDEWYGAMSNNSFSASKNYTRANADKLVAYYLDER